jgi:hypothetical protein
MGDITALLDGSATTAPTRRYARAGISKLML